VRGLRLAAHVVKIDPDAADVVRCALAVYVVPRIDRAGVVGGVRRKSRTCDLDEIIVRDESGAVLVSHTDVELPAVVSDNEPVPILVTVHGASELSSLRFAAVSTDTTEYSNWRALRPPVAVESALAELMLGQDP